MVKLTKSNSQLLCRMASFRTGCGVELCMQMTRLEAFHVYCVFISGREGGDDVLDYLLIVEKCL